MGDSSGTLWSSKRSRTRQPWWTALPDEDLLQMRVKDLGVAVEGTWLNGCVRVLNGELKRKGLIQAHAWLSDEWFSPDTTPGIAIPFYLSHPRLARLEKKMFLDVEGDTRRECMQILRGRKCLAGRRRGTRRITGPTRRARTTSSTSRAGTRKATRMRTSPRRLRCG
jgi:hypothetical protein